MTVLDGATVVPSSDIATRTRTRRLVGTADRRDQINGYPAILGIAWESLSAHRVWLSISIFYIAVVEAVAHATGHTDAVSLSLYSPVMVLLLAGGLPLFALGHLIYVALVVRPDRPLRRLADDWGGRFLTPRRVLGALPVILVLPLFMSAFTSMKIMIPWLNPYSWDPAFSSWDRMLHGGVDPWRLLHPFLGMPTGTAVMNLVYHKWFLIVNAVLLWQALATGAPRLRQQFLIAFVLSWIVLGTGMALLFPAAGPCYFARVTGLHDPYEPLMTYLEGIHALGLNPAFALQEQLWRIYSSGSLALGGGISAMPSMHVALAVLFVLLGYRVGRLAGRLFLLFAGLILLGSIHLGWHYAIDGYAVIPLVWLIWRVSGKFVEAPGSERLPACLPRPRGYR